MFNIMVTKEFSTDLRLIRKYVRIFSCAIHVCHWLCNNQAYALTGVQFFSVVLLVFLFLSFFSLSFFVCLYVQFTTKALHAQSVLLVFVAVVDLSLG